MRLRSELLSLAEVVDHLVSTPVFSGSSLAKRPVVLDLYAAARERFGRPLSFDATDRLLDSLEPKDTVVITTGFIVPPWIRQETDGPVGAVTLARALNLALDVVPVIVTEDVSVPGVSRLMELAGFRVDKPGEVGGRPRTGSVIGFTLDPRQAQREAEKLVAKLSPSSVVAIEKASPNDAGVFHSGVGVDVSSVSAKVDRLIESAKAARIPTVGIGDAGNEIGMGCIEPAVRRILPTGNECGCPCHRGVASAVETDSLIVTGTSNWGAPAMEALLSSQFDAPELLHDGSMERRLIEAAASVGFINPASGFSEPGVDAIPAEIHGAMLDVLNFIVESRAHESFTIRKYREHTKEKSTLKPHEGPERRRS